MKSATWYAEREQARARKLERREAKKAYHAARKEEKKNRKAAARWVKHYPTPAKPTRKANMQRDAKEQLEKLREENANLVKRIGVLKKLLEPAA